MLTRLKVNKFTAFEELDICTKNGCNFCDMNPSGAIIVSSFDLYLNLDSVVKA